MKSVASRCLEILGLDRSLQGGTPPSRPTCTFLEARYIRCYNPSTRKHIVQLATARDLVSVVAARPNNPALAILRSCAKLTRLTIEANLLIYHSLGQ